MTYARWFRAGSRFLIAAACGASIGGFLGAFFSFASAQEGRVGQLDVACANRCVGNGYDADFCGRVCWIPDPAIAARAVPVDWVCMEACLDRGGNPEDCKLRCRRQ
jgi:hypothetical protein